MKIKVKVKPGSKKQEINKISETEYVVSLKSRAEDNKANIELLKLLNKKFKKHTNILKGKTSKNKVLEVN